MNTTAWVEYRDGGLKLRIRATFGWQKLEGNREAYWSVTGETERRQGARWVEHSAGCIHEKIAEYFPFLAPAIRWHLCGQESGPMHYLANSRYFLERGEVEHFKACAVWGAVDAAQTLEPGPGERPVVLALFGAERPAQCLGCRHGWLQAVRYSATTPNLSGEASVTCPACNGLSVSQGPQQASRGGGYMAERLPALLQVMRQETDAALTSFDEGPPSGGPAGRRDEEPGR